MANMELITSVTVGSGGAASVTLPATGTIPATYTDLKILCSTKTNRGTFNNDAINLNLNGSTSNITAIRLFGDGSSASSNTGRGILNNAAASTSVFSSTEIYIPNYTSSNYKYISAESVTENNGTEAYAQLHSQLWSDTAAVTTAVLAPADGTLFLEGSTFYLYGISNVTSTTKATGGIVSSDGTYNYHMFPFSGTFTPTQNITADYLVIAGGGGGAGNQGGGGGAGGLRSTVGATGGGGSLESALSLTANTGYTVTVGAGGVGTWGSQTSGSNSVFSTITSTGGGKGGAGGVNGSSGGSGGGGGYAGSPPVGTGGAASPAGQGNAGGDGVLNQYGGSGGGAGGAGTAGNNASITGGAGVQITAFANATQTGVNSGYYAIGGNNNGSGNGTVNTGNGAQANQNNGANNGGTGGSGLVIIRYAI
jgi:hypothetical protein